MSYVVYDLEASGLLESVCDLQQCAMLVFDDNHILVRAENLYFYKENMHFSEEAYEVNGLSLEFLSQYKDKFEENIIKMYALLNRAKVAGYNNLDYDDPFVTTWLRRNGMGSFAIGLSRDVMQIYKPIYKRQAIKLVKLIPFVRDNGILNLSEETVDYMTDMWFGAKGTVAHDARWDVTATALLFQHALRTGLASFDVVSKNTIIFNEGENALESDYAKEVNTNVNLMETHRIMLTLKAGDRTSRVTVNARGDITEVADQLSADAYTLSKQCLSVPMLYSKEDKKFHCKVASGTVSLALDMKTKELMLDNGYCEINVLSSDYFAGFQKLCKDESAVEDDTEDSQPSPKGQSPPKLDIRSVFEQCNSLSELNARRVQIASSGTVSITEINNAYNRRRTELINTQQSYKKLSPVQLSFTEQVQASSLPLGGRSPKKNTIVISSGGILF